MKVQFTHGAAARWHEVLGTIGSANRFAVQRIQAQVRRALRRIGQFQIAATLSASIRRCRFAGLSSNLTALCIASISPPVDPHRRSVARRAASRSRPCRALDQRSACQIAERLPDRGAVKLLPTFRSDFRALSRRRSRSVELSLFVTRCRPLGSGLGRTEHPPIHGIPSGTAKSVRVLWTHTDIQSTVTPEAAGSSPVHPAKSLSFSSRLRLFHSGLQGRARGVTFTHGFDPGETVGAADVHGNCWRFTVCALSAVGRGQS